MTQNQTICVKIEIMNLHKNRGQLSKINILSLPLFSIQFEPQKKEQRYFL